MKFFWPRTLFQQTGSGLVNIYFKTFVLKKESFSKTEWHAKSTSSPTSFSSDDEILVQTFIILPKERVED